MVDFQLVERLTGYLALAGRFTGELLLDTTDILNVGLSARRKD